MNFQQYFQTTQQELAHPLKLLYKASLKTGEIPMDLKRAIITPLYNDGSRNLPKNYRPVALTSHLIKTIEKILAKIFTNSSKSKPKQHGFRSGRSCLSQLLEHQNKMLEELEKSKCWCYHVDYAKAFNKVDHRKFLNKLKKIELIAKSVCGYTILYQTDNNILPSMKQRKWSSSQKWRTPRVSVRAPHIPNTYIWYKLRILKIR